MSNEEIALLKADNDRLNKIIGIVVEQNELLKLENAFLKKAVTPKDIINSFAKIGMAIKSNENALAKLDEGLRTNTNNLAENKEGNNNNVENHVNFKEGNNNGTKDLDNFNQGNSNGTEGIANNKEGNSNSTRDIATANEADNNVIEVMPSTIEPSDNIIGALEKELKASGYNRISHSGVNNAAKLLIYFYNKGDGSYPELKKITGHSTPGIAKFIMSMKKRGWIHRFGFQQFGLTDNGVALIKQALTKSREN